MGALGGTFIGASAAASIEPTAALPVDCDGPISPPGERRRGYWSRTRSDGLASPRVDQPQASGRRRCPAAPFLAHRTARFGSPLCREDQAREPGHPAKVFGRGSGVTLVPVTTAWTVTAQPSVKMVIHR